jgi:hypothetical protein
MGKFGSLVPRAGWAVSIWVFSLIVDWAAWAGWVDWLPQEISRQEATNACKCLIFILKGIKQAVKTGISLILSNYP